MKVGAEQKGKLVLLAILFVAGVAAYFWGGGDISSGASMITGSTASKLPDLQHLDPTLHLAELDHLRSIEYTGGDRDLFHYVVAAPPPPPRPATPPRDANSRGGFPGAPGSNAAAAPPAPVAPPPLPLQFFGIATPSAGGPVTVLLRLGETVYPVREGETVEKRYLVEKINKLSVHVKDLQTGQEQDLPLYQG